MCAVSTISTMKRGFPFRQAVGSADAREKMVHDPDSRFGGRT